MWENCGEEENFGGEILIISEFFIDLQVENVSDLSI